MHLLKLNEDNRKWWILAAMTASISMIFVDITVLPVVLPTLQRELLISDLGLQWIINAYTLALSVLVLTGGLLGDRWGLKKTFCFGLCCFASASALCGFSTTAWWMIISRVLQGIGGAFLIPATQGIIISHFPPHQRGKAMGLFVSIGSIFLSLGPLIGGSLTTYLSWRYVFWINLPIAAIGMLMALMTVPAMPGKKKDFDITGFLIQALGLCCLVVALMQSQKWGWNALSTLLLLFAGLALLYYLFVRRQSPHATFIDFSLMNKKSFRSSSSCIFLNQFIIMVTVFWAIYFQNILGFSASLAGFYAFIANIPVLFAAPLGGFLVDHFGPRRPVMIGFSLLLFSLSWFMLFSWQTNIWKLMPSFVVFGFGVSMIFTPSYVSLMNEVAADKRGAASGTNSAIRQFSATLGLATFGTIYSLFYNRKFENLLQINPDTSSFNTEQFDGLLSKSTEAWNLLNQLDAKDAEYIFDAARTAFLNAFSLINFFAAGLTLIGLLIAFRQLKDTPIHPRS